MRLLNKVKTYTKTFFYVGLATLTTTVAQGADIFNGKKGPTDWQADLRTTYNRQSQREESANRLILKYWRGSKPGFWAFANIPYSVIQTDKGTDDGLGDIVLGLGPRADLEQISLQLFAGIQLPTGETKGAVHIGTGRYDTKLGVLATYLDKDHDWSLDASFTYTHTGKNKQGTNPPNSVFGGLLIGKALPYSTRLATGFVGTRQEQGNYALWSKTSLRYTYSPDWFFELVGQFALCERRMPETNSLEAQVRFNF